MAFFANVKSVLSGDTLVLTSKNNPSLERVFSLAFVSAPRLNKEGDEPFAFQSREFLRNLAVGKPIQAKVLCEFFVTVHLLYLLLSPASLFPSAYTRGCRYLHSSL